MLRQSVERVEQRCYPSGSLSDVRGEDQQRNTTKAMSRPRSATLGTVMSAQRILDIHKPAFLHHADTLLTMHYPKARITRKPILVQGRIHIGYRFTIHKSLWKKERAEIHGVGNIS